MGYARVIPPSGESHPTRFPGVSVFVGFNGFFIRGMMHLWPGSETPANGDDSMYDLLIALAFIGMVIAPALVAAKSGKEAAEESE